MFNTKDLDLEIIRNRAYDQLLEGTFPSFSGSPDYDDFIRSVINEEAKILLGISGVMNLEDVHDFKQRSSEFLKELLEILDSSFINSARTIQDFVDLTLGVPKEESKSDAKYQAILVRRARRYLQSLRSPWFKAIMDPYQYEDLIDKLKILGKL